MQILCSCIHGVLQSQASWKLNMLQSLAKPKDTIGKLSYNLSIFKGKFAAKVKHILSLAFIEKAQVVRSLFIRWWLIDNLAWEQPGQVPLCPNLLFNPWRRHLSPNWWPFLAKRGWRGRRGRRGGHTWWHGWNQVARVIRWSMSDHLIWVDGTKMVLERSASWNHKNCTY